jgi:subtilisin family serine protease
MFRSSGLAEFSTKILLTSALLMITSLARVGPIHAASNSNNGSGGTIPVLIKSRMALTPDVAAAIGAHTAHVSYIWPEINAMAATVNPSKFGELVADPAVALVEPDEQGQVPGESPDGAVGVAAPSVVVPLPDSSATTQTWNQDMADTSETGYDGTGVTVAVVDSGLPQNWPDFLPADVHVDTEHAAGFGPEGLGDFHSPVNAIRGAGGHIGLFPHGLAVASLITGFPSEYGSIGGAAPRATILPVRVLNQFNLTWTSWSTAGILYVTQLKAEGVLAGPVVINFSIQFHSDSAILKDAIDLAIANHIIFVTIAGDFGPTPGSISFPGRLPESITVGAVGWTKEGCVPPACTSPWFFSDVPENDASQVYVASFSGRESSPPLFPGLIDVLAPGSFVFGEWLLGPGFSEGREVAFDPVDNFIFGTSFAAPHVAGIAAQMMQKNPLLIQRLVEDFLRNSALPISPSASGGLSTPLQEVLPWGSNATGPGLARGAKAVAGTGAGLGCFQLDLDYRIAVSLARLCNPALPVAQCTVEVDDSLICPCPTAVVNPANATAISELMDLKSQFDALDCNHFSCSATSCSSIGGSFCGGDGNCYEILF